MTQRYNVPAEELPDYLLTKLNENTTSMEGVEPDEAFVLGWETCLHHLKVALGDSPAEVKVSSWDYDSFGKPTLVGVTDYFPTH
jgi:hypothetical protein